MSVNTFSSRSSLKVGNKEYEIYRLDALDQQGISTRHLPYSLRILLENLLRTEDGRNVKKEDIRSLASWTKHSKPNRQTPFPPIRRLRKARHSQRCPTPVALVGRDVYWAMITGLGVLGWGSGGIEAGAAMLGQAVSMLVPLVVGVKLAGRLREGASATGLVLTITE